MNHNTHMLAHEKQFRIQTSMNIVTVAFYTFRQLNVREENPI